MLAAAEDLNPVPALFDPMFDTALLLVLLATAAVATAVASCCAAAAAAAAADTAVCATDNVSRSRSWLRLIMLRACAVLAPLTSLLLALELAEVVVLLAVVELDDVERAGAETTGATTLGCDEGAVLTLVVVGDVTGSVTTEVEAVVGVEATDGSTAAVTGGNSLFNASI